MKLFNKMRNIFIDNANCNNNDNDKEENTMSKYDKIFAGMSDEEILTAAQNCVSADILNGMLTESGAYDITQNCCKIVRKIYEKTANKRDISKIGEFAINVNMLCLMLKAIVKKEYSVPNPIIVTTKLTLALGYVVTPVDLIPDAIPFVGYIDDMYVVSRILNTIMTEVEDFKIYLIEKGIEDFKQALEEECLNRSMKEQAEIIRMTAA